MNDKNQQTLSAEIADQEFTFVINRDDYNKYINSITPNNKVAPSHNFLMTTVDQKDKATLKQVLKDSPGSEVQLAGAILEQYTPDLGIVVKKSSSAQSE